MTVRLRAAGLPVCLAALLLAADGGAAAATSARTPTVAEILKATSAADWREPMPENTLYFELASGRVVMELAPEFAPLHAVSIRKLVRNGYFDGLAVIRVQDNFVAQIGDANEKQERSLGSVPATLASEYTVPLAAATPFYAIPDRDGYAPVIGFSQSLPAARDPRSGEQWLTHCYGAVGVARSNEPTSGNGSSLYMVIGHAPRQLDRNLAVVGHVWWGAELLSALPRGGKEMGFYETAAQRVAIKRARVAADVPAAERTRLQILRSDSKSFTTLLEARRNRQDDFYRRPAGFLELCNVAVPVRMAP
jgi:cyclophilin family peptidyl-prolyl cis-trans isomerase